MTTMRRTGSSCAAAAVALAVVVGLAGCSGAAEPAPGGSTAAGSESSAGDDGAAATRPGDLELTLGTQTRIGTTTVGVMTATERDSGVIARLMVTGEGGESEKVVLSPGDEFSLFSEGDAQLVDVLLEGGPDGTPVAVVRPLE